MKLLLYCTKAKPTLYNVLGKFITTKYMGKDFMQDGLTHPELNGKIVAECDYEVEEIRLIETPEYAGIECNTFIYDSTLNFETETLTEDELCKQSCLNASELNKYLDLYKEKEIYGYAIHIKNLHIFDKPKNLFEYLGAICKDKVFYPLRRSPQNMMYAYQRKDKQLINWNNYDWELLHNKTEIEDVNKYILVPVKPDELQRILNDKQKIIIKKQVLKEMK